MCFTNPVEAAKAFKKTITKIKIPLKSSLIFLNLFYLELLGIFSL